MQAANQFTGLTAGERWKLRVTGFWGNVYKTEGCWFWIGYIGNHGYGTYGKPLILAHQLSWQVHFGPIPEGKWVLHSCDIRQCVRPTHLFLGTQKDNMADSAQKGRVGMQRGLDKARFLTVGGKTLPVADWVRQTGLTYQAIHGRIMSGWQPEDVIATPQRNR